MGRLTLSWRHSSCSEGRRALSFQRFRRTNFRISLTTWWITELCSTGFSMGRGLVRHQATQWAGRYPCPSYPVKRKMLSGRQARRKWGDRCALMVRLLLIRVRKGCSGIARKRIRRQSDSRACRTAARTRVWSLPLVARMPTVSRSVRPSEKSSGRP